MLTADLLITVSYMLKVLQSELYLGSLIVRAIVFLLLKSFLYSSCSVSSFLVLLKDATAIIENCFHNFHKEVYLVFSDVHSGKWHATKVFAAWMIRANIFKCKPLDCCYQIVNSLQCHHFSRITLYMYLDVHFAWEKARFI